MVSRLTVGTTLTRNMNVESLCCTLRTNTACQLCINKIPFLVLLKKSSRTCCKWWVRATVMNALNVRCLENYTHYWSSQLSELGIFISVLPTKLSDFFQELNSVLPISRHRALLTLSHPPLIFYTFIGCQYGESEVRLIFKLSIPCNLVHSPVIPT